MPRSGGRTRQWRVGHDSNLGMGGKGGVELSYIAGVKSNSGSHVSPGPINGTLGPGPGSNIPVGDQMHEPSLTNVYISTSTNSMRQGRKEGSRINTPQNMRVKHLPYSELMDPKARGLCFSDGEQYHPLHQCA